MRRQDCEASRLDLRLVAAVATCLSNTRITDEEKLKKIVVFAGVHGEFVDVVDIDDGGEQRSREVRGKLNWRLVLCDARCVRRDSVKTTLWHRH